MLLSFKVNTTYDHIIYEYVSDSQPQANFLKENNVDYLTKTKNEVCMSIVLNYSLEPVIYSKDNVNPENKVSIEEKNNFYSQLLSVNYDNIYISKYTPFLFYSFDFLSPKEFHQIIKETSNKNFISEIYISEKNDKFEAISYNNPEDFTSSTQSTMDFRNIQYDNFPNDTSYTGEDVRIGILDKGIFDTNHSNFDGILVENVTADYNGNYTNDKLHPTMVASVLGGKYGIANKADLYFADVASNDGLVAIERLLDENVDVINMSFGLDKTGYYNIFTYSYFKYLEAIIYSTGVIIVGATGNDLSYIGSSGNVAQPANTTSVISVGSINENGKPSNFSNFRRFNSVDISKSKPEIVAVGENRNIAGFGVDSGTSFSAPAVTGTVALLIEKYGDLINPQTALAILTATSSNDVDKSQTYINGNLVTNNKKTGGHLYERTGAGRLDIKKALNYSSEYLSDNMTLTNFAKSIYLSAGDQVTIALTWNRTFYPHNWYEEGIILDPGSSVRLNSFQNVDLYLKRNGSIVESSVYRYTNIQYLRYVIPTSGTYTISAENWGNISTGFEYNYAISYSYHSCNSYSQYNAIYHRNNCCNKLEMHSFYKSGTVFVCSKCGYITNVPPVDPWSIEE